MGKFDPIIAGVFCIERADSELIDALTTAMRGDLDLISLYGDDLEAVDQAMSPSFIDVRRLRLDTPGEQSPAIFALAMDFPGGAAWIVRGEVVLAMIPISDRQRLHRRKFANPLIDWADTFTMQAAEALLAVAYGSIEYPDNSTHLIVDLPLSGISVHRGKGVDLDEWLDDLTDKVEDYLTSLDADAEIVLFDTSDETRRAISGHIVMLSEGDEDLVTLVTDALMSACSAFTPQTRVRERLRVEIEERCMYDLYEDFLAGMDEDLGLGTDEIGDDLALMADEIDDEPTDLD